MYLSQCYSIIVVICLTYIVEATQCDTSEGPENEFYEALGCREEQSCPLKYNCSMIKKTAEDDCYFRGKIYKSAHRIPDAIESCRVHCRCDNGRTDCPAIDCPLRLTPGCFFVYKDNECCPEIVCPSNSPFTCSYNNKTYLAGTRFEPEKCIECKCEKDFDGELKEPFCKRIKCDVAADEKYYKALNDRCAPLYADEKPCCPAYFSCPDGTETITRSSKPSSDVSCKFGDHEIMAGDEVVLKNPFLATCKCAVPPLITCRTEVPYGTLLRKYYS